MAALDDMTEAWAIKILKESLGPAGFMALAIVLQTLREEIREEIRTGKTKKDAKCESAR